MQLIRWGEKDENGNVLADRNRMMQLVIDELRDKRIKLFNGQTKEDWHDYWLHWSHIYRVMEEDSLGIKRGVWMRSDRDDWVHATIYWRIGVDRFGGKGAIVGLDTGVEPDSYIVNPDLTVDFNPEQLFGSKKEIDAWWDKEEDEQDWRLA
jgi:hypothetical protein